MILFCNITNVFSVAFDQFSSSLLNKIKSYQTQTLLYNQYIKTKMIKTLLCFYTLFYTQFFFLLLQIYFFFFKLTTFLEILDFYHEDFNRVF